MAMRSHAHYATPPQFAQPHMQHPHMQSQFVVQTPMITCNNCRTASAQMQFCHSCSCAVCNFCMSLDEGCCIICLQTFPVAPKSSYQMPPPKKFELYNSPYNPNMEPPLQAVLSALAPHMQGDHPLREVSGQSFVQRLPTPPPPPDPANGQALAFPGNSNAARKQMRRGKQHPQRDGDGGDVNGVRGPASACPRHRAMMNTSQTEGDGGGTFTAGTTMMITNIPCRFGRDGIVEAIHSVGFGPDTYDFVYVPKRNSMHEGNIGYAFVNFYEADVADNFAFVFQDFQFPGSKSLKRCMVKHAHFQGFNAELVMGERRRSRHSDREVKRNAPKAEGGVHIEKAPIAYREGGVHIGARNGSGLSIAG